MTEQAKPLSEEPETTFEIAPVERPIQFDEPQIAFLPEVDAFLWVSQARQAFNVSGAGLTAAVLDTGLNAEHVDFAGRVVAQRNFTPDNGGNPDDAADGNGHGTNVTGIIAAAGIHRGIAPGAGIAAVKVLSNRGGGDFRWIDAALQWVIDNREALSISVVCMSLGDGGNYTSDGFGLFALLRNSIRDKIRTLRAARTAVVIAAGNDYHRHDSRQGMGFPAIIRECVSVGAVYDAAEGGFRYASGAVAHSSAPGQITPFSQRLHESVSPDTYTDIFAPGAPVTSAGINGPQGESVQHGTSQATPVVAGLILLLQEFYRRATGELPEVSELVDWLRRGGVTIHDGDDEHDNVQHTGLDYVRADALSALDAVRRELQKRMLEQARA
ncbi:MAG: S8 family serine peptidase [Chloroflexota bacterium]|nr:S8 family serine peptidase [Chloroflexota bacterium]